MATHLKKLVKRDWRTQLFCEQKLRERIKRASPLLEHANINFDRLYDRVVSGLSDGDKTSDVDYLLATTAAQMASEHPSYDAVARCVELERLYKLTPKRFSLAMLEAFRRGRLAQDVWNQVEHLVESMDAYIVHTYDNSFDFRALRTFQDGYLLRNGQTLLERPQHMFMRVALVLHCRGSVRDVVRTYEALAGGLYIHASPTLFNAGTPDGPLSSCFLPHLQEGVGGLFSTLLDIGTLATGGGGIGLGVQRVPPIGARSTKGLTCGLPPVMRLLDSTVALLTQGDNRRPAAVTVYIEPWHQDILAVLDLKRSHVDASTRTNNLFYALWVPDIFMERVEKNGDWSLFDPSDVPELALHVGSAFSAAYRTYEEACVARTTIPARVVWQAVLRSQIETGGPFLLYKDAINDKSNQSHLGVITHGNLCTEIVQFSCSEETAVCNLASMVLPKFVHQQTFDLAALHAYTKLVVFNLNRVITASPQSLVSAAISDSLHRAIGIGVQGLADTFILLGLPFESVDARTLNYNIAQTIYHAAVEASCDLTGVLGVHSSFVGSPASTGLLQLDLWNHTPWNDLYDWDDLRAKVKEKGLANALLIAYMPTAGTSQLTGVSEGVDPIMSNAFTRRVKSGDYQVISPRLVKDLEKSGVWTAEMRESILLHDGSIQHLENVPQRIRDLYKTVWEIKQKTLIDYASDRGPFICQSQSMTLYVERPTVDKLTSLHFYGWRSGLKTGMYYLRSKPASRPIPVTVSHTSHLANADVGPGGCEGLPDCLGCMA